MADTQHDIKVLNSLIETTLDSADGYSQAAERSSSTSYRNLFQQWSAERQQIVSDLQDQVKALGGTPDTDGSTLAAGHRMFLKLRDRVTEGDASVIAEVERGEDFIKAKYETALEDDELSAASRNVVLHAYTSIKAGHDQARSLKHSFKQA
ncbi:MAG TPA: PA2169 family four-helix-bundle protein [Steroidobacteraceae bacterium]